MRRSSCPIPHGACFCAAARASARWRFSPAATSLIVHRRNGHSCRSPTSMIACRPGCSIRTSPARPFPESPVTRPFPFNAYYPEEDAPEVDEEDYRLEVGGLVDEKKSWTLDQLRALPQETQITRLICVEGWSAIGKWTGTPLRDFLRRVGADTRAKYVWFRCAEGYSTSIDMPTALHPQTQITLQFDGEVLPRKYGFPLKIRIPTKLGFENPKYVMEMAVTNKYLGGYWEDQGYNWFSGS